MRMHPNFLKSCVFAEVFLRPVKETVSASRGARLLLVILPKKGEGGVKPASDEAFSPVDKVFENFEYKFCKPNIYFFRHFLN